MTTSTLRIQLERLGRLWWVVALVTLIFVIGGIISASRATTVYSSRATLAVVSSTRAPEQDAMLAHGYADFFNQASNQNLLRQASKVPDGISLTAEVAAPSPLIYVTATSSSPDGVAAAAAKTATALRDTVNDAIRAGQSEAIGEVRKPFDDIRAANGVVPQQALTQMEDRISQINADTTNQIDIIELRSSVLSSSPSKLTTIGLALAAGLVVGCALALALGAVARRLGSPSELTARTRMTPLGTIPPVDDPHRDERLGQLATALVGLDRETGPICVVSPRTTPDAETIARSVYRELAGSGMRVAVIDADFRTPDSELGLSDFLNSSHSLEELLGSTSAHSTEVTEVGAGTVATERKPINRRRLGELFTELRAHAELVVVIAPPLIESAQAQVICAEAGAALLVTEQHLTTIADIRESQRLIEQAGGTIVGTVVIERSGTLHSQLSNLRQRLSASRDKSENDFTTIDVDQSAHTTSSAEEDSASVDMQADRNASAKNAKDPKTADQH